jgi:hypothetical protein
LFTTPLEPRIANWVSCPAAVTAIPGFIPSFSAVSLVDFPITVPVRQEMGRWKNPVSVYLKSLMKKYAF